MTKTQKEKLFIYCRISGSSQKEGASLTLQEKIGRETAKKHKLKPEMLFEGVASSHHESLDKRPQLRKLLLKIKDGEVKHLYSWDIDRLSRNKKVSSILLMDMEENGVTYYTNQGVVRTSSRDEMLMLEIKSLFASHDNALRTERMKQSKFYKIKKEGIWGGGQIPYGYTTVDKKLTPHKEESKWVKKMFKWYYDGKPIIWIKQQLDKNNVIARRGGLFSTGSIMRLFKNTHHVGYYQHTDKESGEVIDLTCEPIVDESIWNKVQDKVERNQERYKQTAKTKNFYLLRHLLYCEHCGSMMHGKIKPKNRINLYYCPQKGKQWKEGKLKESQKWVRGKVGEHGCDNIRSVNIQLLDSFVCTKVTETLSNSHQLKETFKREILKEKKVGDNDTWEYERLIRVEKTKRTHLEKQLQQYRSSLADIETNLLLGEVTDKELTIQIKDNLVKKFEDAKTKLEQSRKKVRELEQQNSWLDWLSKYHQDYLDWEKFSKEELQDAINNFVDKILIRFNEEKNEHVVTICFKLPLVKDKLNYKDPDDKRKGYRIKKGKTNLEVAVTPVKRGKFSAPLHHYSTVTDFARFRGWSTSVPLATAVW